MNLDVLAATQKFECRVFGVNEYLLRCEFPTSSESFSDRVSAFGAVAAVIISLAVAIWTVVSRHLDSRKVEYKDRRETLGRENDSVLATLSAIALREPETIMEKTYALEDAAARLSHSYSSFGKIEKGFSDRVVSLLAAYRGKLQGMVMDYEMGVAEEVPKAGPAMHATRWCVNELLSFSLLRFPTLSNKTERKKFAEEFEKKASDLQYNICNDRTIRGIRDLSSL